MVSSQEVYVPFLHEKGERKLEGKTRIPKRNFNMREAKGKKKISIACFVCESI
jgi:hypothetical protein